MSSDKIAFSLSCLSAALLTCFNGFCGDIVNLGGSNCGNIVNGFNGDARGNTRGSNGKKVYADYHGVRYTREHDGKLGRWEMYASTEKSSTGRKSLCYNADLIDGSGRHDIAAVSYPLVGMQSNLDEDYIEYQILSAKAAKIDGFFIEWGFFPHENDELLKAMQKVAAKYDFEIGVNWCDGWLYYNWITKIYPEIDSREKKTEYMAKCYRYLADSVYSVPTAAKVGGRPVFYHFGPGATIDEYKSVLAMQHSEAEDAESVPMSKSSSTRSCVKAGNGTCNRSPKQHTSTLVGLRRWADWGHLENDRYIPVTHSDELDSWIEMGEIPAPWIPARVRERDAQHPYWDNYAVEDDLIEFMKPFRDSVWMNPRESYVVKSGFAMPGMDNRGCAGWGRGHFFLIPRDSGKTYDAMWRFCMESRDSLDMMFIASWSDYTEGHEIEPTVENGYRELLTTLKYASEFKDEKCDSTGIELPLRLFQLRKKIRFLSDVVTAGDVCCCNGACATSMSSMSAEDRLAGLFKSSGLDDAAVEIAAGRYDRASKLLDEAEGQAKRLSEKVYRRSVRVEVQECSSCAAAGGNAAGAANPVNSNTVTGSGNAAGAANPVNSNSVTSSGEASGWSKNSDGMKKIYLDDALIKELAEAARYTGIISFEYKDDGQEFLFVRSETGRQPSSLFSVVGKLRTDGSGEWKKAAIELYDRNIVYRNGQPAFRISGNVEIRNVSIELNLFSSRACSCLQGSCL